jgi:hypothetical protein
VREKFGLKSDQPAETERAPSNGASGAGGDGLRVAEGGRKARSGRD